MKKIIFIFMCLLPIGVFANEIVFEKTYDVPENPTIDIDVPVGGIQIIGGTGKKVTLLVKGNSIDKKDLVVDSKLQGDNLTFSVNVKEDKSYNIEYILSVPQKSGHKIATRGGSISVENISGNIAGQSYGGSINLTKSKGKAQMKTKGGSMEIVDFAGDLDMESLGGSVDGVRLKGTIKVRTGGGSMDLKELEGSVDAVTGGGSIDINISGELIEKINAKTGGGSITLTLGLPVDAMVNAKTGFGKIYLFDKNKKLLQSSDGQLNYKFKSGKNAIDLATGAGSIDIYSN